MERWAWEEERDGAGEIVAKRRQAEVELARGKKVARVCRKLGITEQMARICADRPRRRGG
jgi:hypothetical protein